MRSLISGSCNRLPGCRRCATSTMAAMDNRIDNRRPDKRGIELLHVRKIIRPPSAGLGKGEIGVCGHIPRRLKDRANACHEFGLHISERIRPGRYARQHVLQQSRFLRGNGHAEVVRRIEAADRIADRQNAARQAGHPSKCRHRLVRKPKWSIHFGASV